jgi:uncharacterized integral membrane protein
MPSDEAGVRDVKKILRLLQWTLKAAIFFTLFAFALNNPGDVTLHFFFGTQWTGPLVLMVFGVFTLGVVTGVLGMLPKWWRHRRALKKIQNAHATLQETGTHSNTNSVTPLNEHAVSATLYARHAGASPSPGEAHGI